MAAERRRKGKGNKKVKEERKLKKVNKKNNNETGKEKKQKNKKRKRKSKGKCNDEKDRRIHVSPKTQDAKAKGCGKKSSQHCISHSLTFYVWELISDRYLECRGHSKMEMHSMRLELKQAF